MTESKPHHVASAPSPDSGMSFMTLGRTLKRATGLMDTPNEILRQIVEEVALRCKQGDLWSLSLTSRRLHFITEKVLYAKLEIYTRAHSELSLLTVHSYRPWELEKYGSGAHNAPRGPQIVRTLHERPELRRLTKAVVIDRADSFGASRMKESIHQVLGSHDGIISPAAAHLASGLALEHGDAAVAYLLLLLPNLESVSVVCHVPTRDRCPPCNRHIAGLFDDATTSSTMDLFHGFTALTELTLKFHFDKHGFLYGGIFLLPALRKVTLYFTSFFTYFSDWKCPPYTSNVSELCLHEFEPYCDGTDTEMLLRSFANLKILRIRMRLSCVQAHRSPARLFPTFRAQEHSLETLDFWSNETYAYTLDGHTTLASIESVDPMPSFRSFGKLTSLTLTDAALVGTAPDGPTCWHRSFAETAEYLGNMLPPTLENLTHALWNGASHYDRVMPAAERLKWWGSFWTNTCVASQFPNLKKVEVAEYNYDGPQGEPYTIWSST